MKRMLSAARKYLSILFLFALSLTACERETERSGGKGDMRLVIHVSPIAAGAAAETVNPVTEKLRSIRMILVSEDAAGNKKVESNQLVKEDFGEGGQAVSNFVNKAFVVSNTAAGIKHFYFIANEASVTELKFKDLTPPDGIGTASLTALLDSYLPDTTDPEQPKLPDGTEFEQVMKALYFAPEYPIDQGEIFLPYTAYYRVEVTEDQLRAEGGHKLEEMFMVPVATKFFFKFINYRSNTVEVQRIAIKEKHLANYLLAQVGSKDYKKKLPDSDTEYYWIDWLKRISEWSHGSIEPGNDENENGWYNGIYGWISDFAMPEDNQRTTAVLLDEKTDDPLEVEKVTVIRSSDSEEETQIPGLLYLGPYYLPESRNQVTYDNGGTTESKQLYYLDLKLHGKGSTGNDPDLSDMGIDNLQSLFRNTCVLIRITMREGDVQIYGEIFDWGHKDAFGWASGGDII